jgi:hypothetical protein
MVLSRCSEGFQSDSYNLPKTIWIYWDSPEQPKVISDIIKYNQSVLQGWTIHVLNKNTLKDFINPDSFPKDYGNYGPEHQSDWIRLVLLKDYGGCWLDASIIVNSKEAMENLYTRSQKEQSQFTGFSWHSSDKNIFRHPSGASFPLAIENWFIMAPKNGSLITAFLKEYESAMKMTFIEYKKTVLAQNIKVYPIYNINDYNYLYLTQYTCIQKVLQTLDRIPPMIILKSEDSMFKIRVDCNMDCTCIMNKLRNDPKIALDIPYIKLVACDRNTGIDISKYFNYASYSKK